MLSGPRTSAIDAGIVWMAPSERRPRTDTRIEYVASMRVLPALFSDLNSVTSKTSGVSGPACPRRKRASCSFQYPLKPANDPYEPEIRPAVLSNSHIRRKWGTWCDSAP